MEEHTASIEIESPTDARVVSRALDDLHNRLREEHRRVREGEAVTNTTLDEFRALQSAVDASSTGRLVVAYEAGSQE